MKNNIAVIEKIRVANIPVHLFSVESLHQCVKATVEQNEKRLFLHANAHLVELANTKQRWLLDLYNDKLNYIMCDGSGIQFAAKVAGLPVPEKIPYNIWIWDFARFISKNNFSLFLLGSDQETVTRAVENLKVFDRGLNIVGYHHGYFNKEKESIENKSVIDIINRAKPDIILIGFGMPLQEKWVKENFSSISSHAFFTCGGAFDFVSGKNRVAPYLFRKLHLEWLFRFLLEPIRLSGRATMSNLLFLFIVFRNLKSR